MQDASPYSNQETHEQIDRYLFQLMDRGETEAFEQRMDKDAELTEEVERLRLVRLAVSLDADVVLKEKLMRKGQALLDELQQREPAKVINFIKTYSLQIAAVVLLLFMLGLVWYSNENYNHQVLAQSNYQSLNTPALLSGDSKTQLEQAFNAFQSKNYEEAISLFGSVPSEDANYPTAQLYAGYSHFQVGSFGEAALYFERVIELNDSRYKSNAEWHRLLALLGANSTEPTSIALNEILRNPDHPFHEKAGELAKTIQSSFYRLGNLF